MENFKAVNKQKLGAMLDREVANAIVSYKTHIKQLNDEVDEAKEMYAALEQELLKRYEEDGCTSTTFMDTDGRKRTLYVSSRLNPIAKFSYGDEEAGKRFFCVLQANGYDHLLHRTPGEAMRSARSIFKEHWTEHGELPMGLDDLIEMKQESVIGMRSS